MQVIPAIDLKGGAAVQLVGGDVKDERYHVEDPIQQARDFLAKGAKWIHVVDLDRALGAGTNLQLICRMLEEVPEARFQVGGGIRFTEDIDHLLRAGAARVVVGTRAVTDDKWFAHCCGRYGNRLVAAIDAREDEILIKGWQESSGKNLHEWAKRADELGVGGLLYTDVSKEGRLSGANVDKVRELASTLRAPIIASGGIRDLADIEKLAEAGAWGIVVGMAAYSGSLDLPAAYKKFPGGGTT